MANINFVLQADQCNSVIVKTAVKDTILLLKGVLFVKFHILLFE